MHNVQTIETKNFNVTIYFIAMSKTGLKVERFMNPIRIYDLFGTTLSGTFITS